MLSVQNRSSKLALCSLTMLLATAAAMVGAQDAHADPLTCDDINARVRDRNDEVKSKLAVELSGKKHRLLLNDLLLTGVASVQPIDGQCALTLVVNAKIDRKLRKDAVGTITMRVQASGNSTSATGFDLSISHPHIESVDLSRTHKIAEKGYKAAGNFLLNEEATIHLD